MHKTITDRERHEQDFLIENHTKALNHYRSMKKSETDQTTLYNNKQQQALYSTGAHDTKASRSCFVCNKVFREAVSGTDVANTTNSIATNNLNKTFIRHMQIQHGLNERGERLVECPVCEKNFFNQQQMERHMHTHEVWVRKDMEATNDVKEVAEVLDATVSSIAGPSTNW